MDLASLRALAPGSALADRAVALESVDSTMDRARERLRGEEPPLLVLAETQTRGRGRGGSTWHSPPGDDLWLTAALALPVTETRLPPFALAVGTVLFDVVAERTGRGTGEGLTLKWPNDLWWRESKLAGVLCESAGRGRVLVGVGLNVNSTRFPEDLTRPATSMRLAASRLIDRTDVLAGICTGLEQAAGRYAAGGFAAFAEAWRARCTLWGRRIRVGDLEGTMDDVDDGGALVVGMGDGEPRPVLAGHVEMM